jgi:VanZ family protein
MRILRHVVLKFPAVAYMAFIFYMSSGPVESQALQSFPDYVLHAGGYSLLYVLVYIACHGSFRPNPGRGGYVLPLVITALYGLSDEIHQSFVPSRDAAIHDFVADLGGGCVGIVISLAIQRIPLVQRCFDLFNGLETGPRSQLEG